MKRFSHNALPNAQHPPPPSGFALILALSIMAFTLLLLLSLTTLIQVELAASDIQLQQQLARENARLALYTALGQLQKHAGPDQRVSARAEIIDSDPINHPYWTGVWDTTQPHAAPTWLVSGNHPDPAADFEKILLLGAHAVGSDTDKHVYAPVQATGGDPHAKYQHRYAYWVGDEGLKSSLLKPVDLAELEDANMLSARQLKRTLQLTPLRPNNTPFFSALRARAGHDASNLSIWSPIVATFAGNVDTHHALNLIPEFGPYHSAQATTEVNTHFHDVTPLALGVLANTATGGLKQDLSDPTLHDPNCPFPMNSEFWNFITQRTDQNDAAHYRGVPHADDLHAGDPINPVAPVMTEFGLYLGLFYTDTTYSRLKIAFCFRAEFWNPHAVRLRLNQGAKEDFIIKITGLPQLTLTKATNTSYAPHTAQSTGTFTFNPNVAQFVNQKSGEPITLDNFFINPAATIEAGKIRNKRVYADAWLPADLNFGDNSKSVSISATASAITVEIQTASGERLQKFDPLEFQPIAISKIIEARSGNPSDQDYDCLFTAKFYNDTLADMEKLLSELDARKLVWSPADNQAHASTIAIEQDPAFAIEVSNTFLQAPEFFYIHIGAATGDENDTNYRFYDFPTTNPISVGYLTNLSFHLQRPFSIGNPWGGAKNEIFDRYFFSTVPRNGYTSLQLQNHHLIPIESQHLERDTTITQGQHTAKHLMVQGAFNINSTSVAAWKAILAGIQLRDWKYKLHHGALTKPTVNQGIFRFPFSADQIFYHPYEDFPNYPEVSQAEREYIYKTRRPTEWGSSFSFGMRELRTGKNAIDPIADVDDLARAIVQQLKARGKPVHSMQELVTGGLIQAAIDQTTINTVGATTYHHEGDPANKFPRYSPSFLGQADVLNYLAPFASPRSDTFIIRAYGEAKNKIHSHQTSKAWCEATVQRIPQPHQFTNTNNHATTLADYTNSPSPFGRTFKIINFKWLSENEI